MIKFINAYNSKYLAELCRDRPADSTMEREFSPRDVRPHDGLIVSVFPELHSPWIGKFTFGETSFDALVACPSPTRLLVVSHGACYLVDVERPSEYWVPFSAFAQGSACLANPNLILLWDVGGIVATDGEVTRWKWEERIDGITEVRQTAAGVFVTAYVPAEQKVTSFLLDALTGNEA